ncbi:Rpn family recombination-promoting nuclease/putative transposase [Lachnospiraceae bacterium ZAX-1]
MKLLEHRLTNDILFKMLFVKYPELLKKLVAVLLGISLESITEFAITNPEIPPEALGEKFCRLDINMAVNGQRVDLEVQVANEGDYPERSLYYWAREFSSALGEGNCYSALPRTIVVSIVAFDLFSDYDGFHSEYEALEVRRHTRLTDKQSLHYFELPKIPQEVGADDKLELWLSLFAAKTEEDLAKIEELEVPEMSQAIGAYRDVVAAPVFKEAERLRSLARHNEASALNNAEQRGEQRANAKWESVVADKDSAIAKQVARIAELERKLGEGK